MQINRRDFLIAGVGASALPAVGQSGPHARVEIVRVEPHPYGVPRPFDGSVGVPLETSIYLELTIKDSIPSDVADPNSVEVGIQPAGGEPRRLLSAGQRFAEGCRGTMTANTVQRGLNPTTVLSICIETSRPLAPNTRYTVRVTAATQDGARLDPDASSWSFVTEEPAGVHPVSFALDLAQGPVRWQGAFFSGSDKTSFGSDWAVMRDTYDLMNEVRRRYPKAFSLERDNHLLAGHLPDLKEFARSSPNLVREQETRQITAIRSVGDATELTVEDFFGHEQYGIASDRPLSADYHAGDTILVADARQHSTARVLRVSDSRRTVQVTPLARPLESWNLTYSAPLPTTAPPDWPGLFPKGGCYLFKFDPPGTPRYYWGRVDSEWDRAHRIYGRRLIVSLTEAPGDLSIDGRGRTTAKDYAEHHRVIRAITDRIVKRHGKAAMEFYWFVFGEPDLGILFWRTDWKTLQKFYDYTVDAVLRAFEDNGYDSERVKVGGLGLAASAGLRDLYLRRLRPFLIHCSPTAPANGEGLAVLQNAAYADERLDGRRSRRVETLCREHGGRGTPCDFISIHCYDGAGAAAARLKNAKTLALEVDPRYYDGLWVLSDACCPGWHFPPDQANRDSYAGNGYFSSWAADLARRQLAAAQVDPRFACGETAITLYPDPDLNLAGAVPAFTCRIAEDTDGDTRPERYVTVKQQIFHMVEMLASMGDSFYVLPELRQGRHTLSGMASRTGEELRILLYSHDEQDVQSRSGRRFRLTLQLSHVPWAEVEIRQYRMDADHNSYYLLREKLGVRASYRPEEVDAIRVAGELRETATPARVRARDEMMEVDVGLSRNGVNFLVLRRA